MNTLCTSLYEFVSTACNSFDGLQLRYLNHGITFQCIRKCCLDLFFYRALTNVISISHYKVMTWILVCVY